MNKKGFTLIELLAVIVILAVIALITVPAVMSVVSDAKQSAFKDSAYGLIKTADSEYVQDTFEDNIIDKFFLFTNGVMTSYPTGSTLDYKGSTPLDGGLVLHSDGTVTMAIHDGTYCATKTRYVSEVTISAKTKANCNSEILYSQATMPFSNLITNGDFSNGTTGFYAYGATIASASNKLSITGNGVNSSPYASQITSVSSVIDKIIYLRAKQKVMGTDCTILKLRIVGDTWNGATTSVSQITNPVSGSQYTMSGTVKLDLNYTGLIRARFTYEYVDNATAIGKVMEVEEAISVDLTATFGAGTEPTTAQMDHNLNKVWIDTANSNTPKRFTAGGWISF